MGESMAAAEVQELVSSLWFHYDQAHIPELATRLAPDVHYSCRSDSGATAYEDFIRADTHGRNATIEWLDDHRRNSPYPLRHNSSNIFRTGLDGGRTTFACYILVTTVVDGRPRNVSSGIARGSASRGPDGPWLTSLEVVLDTIDSTVMSPVEVGVDTVPGS